MKTNHKPFSPSHNPDKQRRVSRMSRGVKASDLLSDDEQPRRRNADPTLYEPTMTFEDWDR